MLKTTSEELACPREDLSVARKDELRKLLLEQVPTVLGLLTGEAFTAAVHRHVGRVVYQRWQTGDAVLASVESFRLRLVCRYPRDLLGQTQHHRLHPSPLANLRGKR